MGHFYYAARAFDLMERMDPNPEYWEGKRGACAGAFQLIVAGHEPRYAVFLFSFLVYFKYTIILLSFNRETLREILLLLRNTSSPQADTMVKVMRKWAKENNINV